MSASAGLGSPLQPAASPTLPTATDALPAATDTRPAGFTSSASGGAAPVAAARPEATTDTPPEATTDTPPNTQADVTPDPDARSTVAETTRPPPAPSPAPPATPVAVVDQPPTASALDNLRGLCAQLLPPATAAQLLSLAWPAVWLASTEPDHDPAGSHLGGAALLPPRMPWPHRDGAPLSFLLQIRLDEVAPHDDEGALPGAGLLTFFYGGAEEAWGFDPDDRPSWRVLLIDPAGAVVRPAPVGAEVFGERRLRPSATLSLPDRASAAMQELLTAEPAVEEVLTRWHRDRPAGGHQLLGWPHDGHDEMQRVCRLASNGIYAGAGLASVPPADGVDSGTPWRLLLQLDNDDAAEMVWGDECRLYFWLPSEQLGPAGPFDPASGWLVWRCG